MGIFLAFTWDAFLWDDPNQGQYLNQDHSFVSKKTQLNDILLVGNPYKTRRSKSVNSGFVTQH